MTRHDSTFGGNYVGVTYVLSIHHLVSPPHDFTLLKHTAWAPSRSRPTATGAHRRSAPSSTSTLGMTPCPGKSSR